MGLVRPRARRPVVGRVAPRARGRRHGSPRRHRDRGARRLPGGLCSSLSASPRSRSWAPMATLPIYSYRPFLPPAPAFRGLETVIQDLQLVFIVTLTPLVFLIVYGYATHGLAGAAVWSLAALGLHVMLKRLTERRIAVEEQNRRLEALNRELEHRERLSAIGKMSSVISHQVLQQLGVIGIYADLIRHAEAEGDPAAALGQAKASAAAIEDALGGVNRVLEDLLVFGRDLRLNLYEHRLSDVLD